MIHFIRADGATGARQLGEQLAEALSGGKRVLWLVSGGSNIPITVAAMQQIPDELTPRLTVMPMDERYGQVGHADSNFRQLQDAGFDPKQAAFLPVLDSTPPQATADAYAHRMERLLADNDVIIGQFGIGADGHVAGILPHSPAAAETRELSASYQGPNFTRITLTFPALRRITTAYAFAYGASKAAALHGLCDGALPPDVQPAQILRAIPEAYVYNDQLEEEGAV